MAMRFSAATTASRSLRADRDTTTPPTTATSSSSEMASNGNKNSWNRMVPTEPTVPKVSDTAAGEEFVVRLQHPCDQVLTLFAPATWQMDRGEIVLRAANGQAWRFEEGEDAKWQRVPQTASPLLMVRK